MKLLSILLAIVLVIMLIAGHSVTSHAILKTSVDVQMAEAAGYPQLFSSIRSQLLSGESGQMSVPYVPENADECRIIEAEITLKNTGKYDAEWLNIQVEETPNDISVYYLSGTGEDIPANSTRTVSVRMLAYNQAYVPHSVDIQYYVLGHSYTVTASF